MRRYVQLTHLLIATLFLLQAVKAMQNAYQTTHIGCYKDGSHSYVSPAFSSRYTYLYGSAVTVKSCTDICYSRGNRYAGIQSWSFCYCTDSGYNKFGKESGSCHLQCSGNRGQKCGGRFLNSVYRIDGLTTTSTTTTTPITTTTTTPSTTTTTPATTTTTTTTTTSTYESLKKFSNSTQFLGGRNNQGDKMRPGLETYIGSGVGAFAAAMIIVVVALVIFKRRNSQNVKSNESTKKYNNLSYLQSQVEDGSNTPGGAFQNSEYAASENNPNKARHYSNTIAYERVDLNSGIYSNTGLAVEEHSAAIYSNISDIPVQTTATDHNVQSYKSAQKYTTDVYSVVHKKPSKVDAGSAANDVIYSLAEEVDDDLVVVENDLYGT